MLCVTVDSIIRMPLIMPEHHQKNGIIINFVKQVIWKFAEIRPTKAA